MLSIVIPTHNKWPRLHLTLVALEAVVNGCIPFEVVLVDDGSSDGTYERIPSIELPYSIRVIRHTRTKGRSAARNTGIDASRYERVLFLDDDCLVTPEIVRAHTELSSAQVGHGYIFNMPQLKFFKDPATGTFWSDLIVERNPRTLRQKTVNADIVRHQFATIIKENCKMNALERLARKILASPQHVHMRWVACAGTNLSVSKLLLNKIRFDESFGLEWGVEDLDFGLRLQREGMEIRSVQGASVYHLDHLRTDVPDSIKRGFDALLKRYPERNEISLVRRFLCHELELESLLELGALSCYELH